MKFKMLSRDKDLQTFSENGKQAYNVDIPASYFKKGRIVGVFSDSDDLIGGAAIITEGPFRSFDIIPKEMHYECGIHNLNQNDLCELNAIFLDPQINSLIDIVKFWAKIALEIKRSRKKWVVFPFNADIKGLAKLYGPTGMKTVYNGSVGHMSTHKNICIALCPASSIYRCFLIQGFNRFVKVVVKRKPARGISARRSNKAVRAEQAT